MPLGAINRIYQVANIVLLPSIGLPMNQWFWAGLQNLHFFSGYCNKDQSFFAKSVSRTQPSEAKVASEVLPVARPKLSGPV
jgi:hypothetical protein